MNQRKESFGIMRLRFNRVLQSAAVRPLTLWMVLSCLLCGCETGQTYDDIRKDFQARLRTVVVEDGISMQEADIIAQSYFIRFGPGCGAAENVIDGGEFWISKTYVGIAAFPTPEPIRIGKRTGRVTWSNGPTIENPKTIL